MTSTNKTRHIAMGTTRKSAATRSLAWFACVSPVMPRHPNSRVRTVSSEQLLRGGCDITLPKSPLGAILARFEQSIRPRQVRPKPEGVRFVDFRRCSNHGTISPANWRHHAAKNYRPSPSLTLVVQPSCPRSGPAIERSTLTLTTFNGTSLN